MNVKDHIPLKLEDSPNLENFLYWAWKYKIFSIWKWVARHNNIRVVVHINTISILVMFKFVDEEKTIRAQVRLLWNETHDKLVSLNIIDYWEQIYIFTIMLILYFKSSDLKFPSIFYINV